jgi:hypothetical protein
VSRGMGCVSRCCGSSWTPPADFAERIRSSIQPRSRGGFGFVEHETEGDRRVQPQCASPTWLILTVPPGDHQGFVAPKLGRDRDLQVRKHVIGDADGCAGVTVEEGSHGSNIEPSMPMRHGCADPASAASAPGRVLTWVPSIRKLSARDRVTLGGGGGGAAATRVCRSDAQTEPPDRAGPQSPRPPWRAIRAEAHADSSDGQDYVARPG